MSDPRYTDPRLSDPVLRRDETIGGPWSWVAGIAVIALIAFLVIIGANSNSNTASNNTAPRARQRHAAGRPACHHRLGCRLAAAADTGAGADAEQRRHAIARQSVTAPATQRAGAVTTKTTLQRW